MMDSAEFAAFLAKDVPKVIETNLKKRMKKMEMMRYFVRSKVDTEWVDSRQIEAMGPARMAVEGAPLPKLEMKIDAAKRKTHMLMGESWSLNRNCTALRWACGCSRRCDGDGDARRGWRGSESGK